jgi:NADH/NAD ratio-sensing transcriptional regulator Rex
MVDAGLRAVLNFGPVQIDESPGVKLRSVDLRFNLDSLSFYLTNRDQLSWKAEEDESRP